MRYSLPAAGLSLLALASLGSLLAGCHKDRGTTTLEGPLPMAGFTVTLDSTRFPVLATFTNTTADGFSYTWDFGDGSKLGMGTNVTHAYIAPGTYKVRLTAAGRGGTAITPQKEVTVTGICRDRTFAALTACGSSGLTSWVLSDQPGAIQRLSSSGAVLSSSAAPLPACQANDEFSFGSNFTFGYDAQGDTYAGGVCGPDASAKPDFVFRPKAGAAGLGTITLQDKASYIALPELAAVTQTYDILEVTATRLRLQATAADGTRTVLTFKPQTSAVDRVKQLLTGGSSRTWMLDNTVASTIIVGTENNPAGYYPGGALGSLPSCQADDEFTFSINDVYTYNAVAETFVAGAYSCQAPRSDTTPYVFGPTSGQGMAQFKLTKAGTFIGVTDAPASRVYRILDIDSQHMTLRAGTASDDPVFTMRLRVK